MNDAAINYVTISIRIQKTLFRNCTFLGYFQILVDTHGIRAHWNIPPGRRVFTRLCETVERVELVLQKHLLD